MLLQFAQMQSVTAFEQIEKRILEKGLGKTF